MWDGGLFRHPYRILLYKEIAAVINTIFYLFSVQENVKTVLSGRATGIFKCRKTWYNNWALYWRKFFPVWEFY